jgi:hypothetical protein
VLVASGQRVVIGGWYLDPHHHRVFLRPGEPAPICPQFGPATVVWRLLQAVPPPGRTV